MEWHSQNTVRRKDLVNKEMYDLKTGTVFPDSRDLTFVCPCMFRIIVNYDQQVATILAYLFIPNQLYMFRAMSSPIIRSIMDHHHLGASSWMRWNSVPSHP